MARGPRLIAYLKKVKELLNSLERYNITHIPREENQKADRLAKLASSDNPEGTEVIPIETLESPSFESMEMEFVLETEPEKESWMTPIKNFLKNGTLPSKKSEKRAVVRKATRYVMQDDTLYRQGFSMPLLRCIAHDDIKRVLREVHEGECGDHTGGQTLAKKISRYG